MEIRVCKGCTVGGDEQVGIFKPGGVDGSQLDLDREIAKLEGFGFLGSQDGGLVVGRCFPLLKGNRIHGASGQTVAQAVAVVLPEELCLAIHNANGTLMAGVGTQAAAIALIFVNGDDSSDHRFTSCCCFVAL